MRARLITALALGCSLHAGPAWADDFDDDFGSLPPPSPKPALAPAAEPARPSPTRAPEAHSATVVVDERVDSDAPVGPAQGDGYPPLDEDDPDPMPEAQARPDQFMHSTIDGLIGGVHLVDASSAWPGSFRIAVHGGYFAKDGFLSRGDGHRQGSGILTLSVSPIDHLELAANVSTYSSENRGSEPRVVQAVGDTHLFAKGYARVLPWLSAGGDVELGLLNGVGSFGLGNGAVNVGLRGSASADLRRLPRGRGLPLILRGNLRYLFDNSGKLVRDIERDRYASLLNPAQRDSEYRHLLTPSERYALQVNRVDRLVFGFGAELLLRPHPRVHVHPLLEWTVALPINRQGYDCLATTLRGPSDGCLDQTGFAARPSTITFGVRTQPYVSGLGVLLAVDVATSGARTFVRELAPESRYMLRFSLSYAFDPRASPAPRMRVQRIEVPVASQRGHIVGQVVDAQTGAALSNAIVHFEGTSLSDVVSDDAGAFRSAELGPGAQGMRVRAEGYRDALCVAVLTSQGSDVNARCELTPSAYYGALSGRVTDNTGRALANARIALHGASDQRLDADAEGAFSLGKLIEGSYELVATADGHFPRTMNVTVSRGSTSAPAVVLIPRAEQPTTRVIGKRVQLLRPIAFAPDSAILLPEAEPVLSELVEQLRKHPELTQLEIQAHGEDTPVTPGAAPLTQQRADAVRSWLIEAGVAAERLQAKGYGSSRPLVPNITVKNRNRNRRIEIVAR